MHALESPEHHHVASRTATQAIAQAGARGIPHAVLPHAEDVACVAVRDATRVMFERFKRVHLRRILRARATAIGETRIMSTSAFPKKLCPLVFIYRSPTVKTEIRLQAKIFDTQVRAVK